MSAAAYVHDRATYAALVYGLHRAGRSGTLEVKNGRSFRRLSFVGGQPVSFSSNSADEGLEKSLVRSGLVPAKQMQWLAKKLNPGEDLAEALVLSGVLEQVALDEHRAQMIERGVGSPLVWERGSWIFSPADDLNLDRIDPALLPPVVTLRGLWNGVRHHVHMNDAIGIVTDTSAGAVVPGKKLIPLLHQMELEAPLDEIGKILKKSVGIEELFRAIPDRSGHLVQLVWFLETAGVVTRADREQTEVLRALCQGVGYEGLVKKAGAKASRSSPASGGRSAAPGAAASAGRRRAPPTDKKDGQPAGGPAPGKLTELVRTAHSHRMGGDFYAFFGVDGGASLAEVDEAYERLTGLWKRAGETPGLDPEAKGMVAELLGAADLVKRTLGVDAERVKYDKLLLEGKAPSLRGTPAGKQAAPSSAESGSSDAGAKRKVRALVERGEFARALPKLRKLRIDDPSNAMILADLGWCMWRLREGLDSEDEGPEDYLLLAHTFDGKSEKALEYLCRIAQEKGDSDSALQWANRLVSLAPSNSFAKAALAAVEEGGSGKAGRRGRLWGKGP